MFLLALQDYHRWQPWFYQYFLILLLLIPMARLYKKYENAEHLLFAVQLIIAIAYFYSGLFKLNSGFVKDIVPYYSNPIAQYFWTYRDMVYSLGGLIPWLEIALSIGLFVPVTRKWAVIGCTLLHLGILYLLGPFGLNTNAVIWPWNIALIALLWLAFFKMDNFKIPVYFGRLGLIYKLVLASVVLLLGLSLLVRLWLRT